MTALDYYYNSYKLLIIYFTVPFIFLCFASQKSTLVWLVLTEILWQWLLVTRGRPAVSWYTGTPPGGDLRQSAAAPAALYRVSSVSTALATMRQTLLVYEAPSRSQKSVARLRTWRARSISGDAENWHGNAWRQLATPRSRVDK